MSEGQALAAHAGRHDKGLKVTPLQGRWVELLQALEFCGPVMALTRNESTVIEKTGVYENISATGHMGLALGDAELTPPACSPRRPCARPRSAICASCPPKACCRSSLTR